jgi:DNA invertase Pin-like site-specific DNA recombinase
MGDPKGLEPVGTGMNDAPKPDPAPVTHANVRSAQVRPAGKLKGVVPEAMGPKFVAYRRVSTEKQVRRVEGGEKKKEPTGLGLEAQDRMINDYVSRMGGVIVAAFVEVESGKRADRPELKKALAAARKNRATLIVAKLDRLARNVRFVSTLLETPGVEFKAADFPEANRMMIQILAVVAEYEAKLISDRTKQALQSLRAKGVQLGTIANLKRGASPAPQRNRDRANVEAARAKPIIESIRDRGITSITGITKALNDEGYMTERQGEWHRMTVKRLLDRLKRLYPPALALTPTPPPSTSSADGALAVGAI